LKIAQTGAFLEGGMIGDGDGGWNEEVCNYVVLSKQLTSNNNPVNNCKTYN